MEGISRRDALKLGGLSFAGLAGLSLFGCSSGAGATAGASQTANASQTASTSAAVREGQIIAREAFVGLDELVELADGSKMAAINFDNAATTPALVRCVEAIQEQLPLYGSIGRGKGQKQAHSTEVFNGARAKMLDFVSAPDSEYTAVWSGTTTDALNKVAGALVTDESDVVLTTRMEHHANDLPWRERARVVYADVDTLGRLKLEDIEALLAENEVKVVSVQAANNVTGYVNDVHAIAKMAHDAGAVMIVDGAQIAAHRAFSMKGNTEAEDIDFFVCSAHKMYAPFGSGAIVAKTALLDEFLPAYRGGGMVDIVSDADVTWLSAPERWEAGSPNYFGVVALGAALDTFGEVGFDAIERHEQGMIRKVLDGLTALPKVTVYGDTDDISDKVGVVTFNVEGAEAADIATQLAGNHGIAVRQGEFCAHPYCHRLLGVSDEEVVAGMHEQGFAPPAMVRISFGMYNDEAEVDAFLEAMSRIAS